MAYGRHVKAKFMTWSYGPLPKGVPPPNPPNFNSIAFPLIRKVVPNLIAQELVSVQPMPHPTGFPIMWKFTHKSLEKRALTDYLLANGYKKVGGESYISKWHDLEITICIYENNFLISTGDFHSGGEGGGIGPIEMDDWKNGLEEANDTLSRWSKQ